MKDKVFVGASLVAALVASFCCILPIVFALAGVGIVGASSFFAAWRPYLLAVTFALLGIGSYFAYRKPREVCEPGSACARPAVNRSGRIGLWIATVFVVGFAAFPYYSGPVADLLLSDGDAQASPAQQAPAVEHISFAIEGMYCPACATNIESKLRNLPGVQKARVSYEQRRADVEYVSGSVSREQFEKVIQDAGYRAHQI